LEGWMKMFEATMNELDRDLTNKEELFLMWLYEQHLNEGRQKLNQHNYIK